MDFLSRVHEPANYRESPFFHPRYLVISLINPMPRTFPHLITTHLSLSLFLPQFPPLPLFLFFFLSSRHLHIWCALQTANFRRTSERAHVLLIRSKKIKNRRDSGCNIINRSFCASIHLITCYLSSTNGQSIIKFIVQTV